MEHTYTRRVQSEVDEINNENLSDSNYDLGDKTGELKKLVNEFNRTFSEGLILLVKHSSDSELNNLDEMEEFVKLKLKSIGISKDKTISNWLTGAVNHPEANNATRDRIYRLCFALSVSIEDVNWFFNHVYFQKSFNCRRIEEAVYYYCFKNNYDYKYAQQLISEIQAFPEPDSPNPETILYTTEIQDDLSHCSTDEDLKQYFRKNKWTFQENQANQRAEKYIYELLENIQGKETDWDIAKKVQSGEIKYDKDSPEITSLGLVVQEVLLEDQFDFTGELDSNSPLNRALYSRGQKNFSSRRLMFQCIYNRIGSKEDIHIEEINLPEKRRERFPSEKNLSDLLKNGLCTVKNYDAIRKCLILLVFYQFWCEYKLHPFDFPSNLLHELYLSETNDYLTTCGYEELYSGDCYDRLFILCSRTITPLETFRAFISDAPEFPDNKIDINA